jgi:hypothetical protein
LEHIDRETGEVLILRHRSDGELVLAPDPAVSVLVERYALQSVVRDLLPGTITAKCLRVSFRSGGAVDVFHSPAHQSASFGGLVTCGSVWNCPVCAAKISERRRLELIAAIAAWEALGGFVVLLTLTHPHTRLDSLESLLEAETKALKRFFGCRQGRQLMAELGRVGQVRAWEVTHGRNREVNNGWHPHFHILLFLDKPLDSLILVEGRIFQIWSNVCVRAGLGAPSRAHGVRLDDGSNAAQYVAKMGLEEPRTWGLDAEMTKGHIKRAGSKGETPFDFLRACLAGDDPQARILFREFSAAFKGKRQLVWSRGLRDRLGLSVVAADAELAAEQEADALLLASLCREEWALVLRFDARGELLELARRGSAEPVRRLLMTLAKMGASK